MPNILAANRRTGSLDDWRVVSRPSPCSQPRATPSIAFFCGTIRCVRKNGAHRQRSALSAPSPTSCGRWTSRAPKDGRSRARYLDQIGRRQPEIWNQVAGHIQMRQPKDYDKAVSLLTDLHVLAVRRGQTVGFQTELEKIRQVHALGGSAAGQFLLRARKQVDKPASWAVAVPHFSKAL